VAQLFSPIFPLFAQKERNSLTHFNSLNSLIHLKDDQIFLFPSLALPGRKRHERHRRQRTYSESQNFGPVSDILEVCGRRNQQDSSSSGENEAEDLN